jgi:hypothetical protein
MSRTCSTHGREEECIYGFEGKARRMTPLGRPGRKWKNNVKTDLRKIGWGGMDRIHLAQDTDQWRTFMNPVMQFWGQ